MILFLVSIRNAAFEIDTTVCGFIHYVYLILFDYGSLDSKKKSIQNLTNAKSVLRKSQCSVFQVHGNPFFGACNQLGSVLFLPFSSRYLTDSNK